MKINPKFLNSVVGLVSDQNGEPDWIASGFLYNYRRSYYIVTNKSVLKGLPYIFIVSNSQEEPEFGYDLDLEDRWGDRRLWTCHPNPEVDIAVIPIFRSHPLAKYAIDNSFSYGDVANIEKMEKLGIYEGEFIYMIGYYNVPIDHKLFSGVVVRGGIVSRIRNVLVDEAHEFLIEPFSNPVYGGSPVVYVKNRKSYLVGVTSGFRSSIGIEAVHPMDFVNEVIDSIYEKSLFAAVSV